MQCVRDVLRFVAPLVDAFFLFVVKTRDSRLVIFFSVLCSSGDVELDLCLVQHELVTLQLGGELCCLCHTCHGHVRFRHSFLQHIGQARQGLRPEVWLQFMHVRLQLHHNIRRIVDAVL